MRGHIYLQQTKPNGSLRPGWVIVGLIVVICFLWSAVDESKLPSVGHNPLYAIKLKLTSLHL
jgi:hypothetical protein